MLGRNNYVLKFSNTVANEDNYLKRNKNKYNLKASIPDTIF